MTYPPPHSQDPQDPQYSPPPSGYPQDPQYDPSASGYPQTPPPQQYQNYGGGGYGVPPSAQGAPPGPSERGDAATANYLGLLGVFCVFGWVGPMIYRNGAGTTSPFVRASATKALNFHLSMLIYAAAIFVTMCILSTILAFVSFYTLGFGFLLWNLIVWGVSLAWAGWIVAASCMGGAAANRGEIYEYPGSLNLIK